MWFQAARWQDLPAPWPLVKPEEQITAAIARCERCDRVARFRFAAAGSVSTLRCWWHAVFYGPVVRQALKVAAVVGTVLFLINQLDVVLSGKVTPLVVLKIALTYVTPFLVSIYSALEINRLRAVKPLPSEPPPTTPGVVA
jgi:hypothetical protein